MAGKVLVEIMGGLGNQLFQYAAGLELARAKNKELILDLRRFGIIGHSNRGTKRKFGLQDLGIEIRYATTLDLLLSDFIKIVTSRRLLAAFPGILSSLEARGLRAFKERHFHYEPFEGQVGSFSVISGYFQSENYFPTISSSLRNRILLEAELPARLSTLMAEIASSSAICVHVRRGDYLDFNLHGALRSSYYERGVQEIESKSGVQPIYVFSDDIAWCKANLNFRERDVRFVDEHLAGTEDTHHLLLMSSFRNFVIANSSFSWWGAWLSGRKGKIVVAPETWFMGAPAIDTSDLIPKTWIRIPNEVSRP
jgi:hypothetical protein